MCFCFYVYFNRICGYEYIIFFWKLEILIFDFLLSFLMKSKNFMMVDIILLDMISTICLNLGALVIYDQKPLFWKMRFFISFWFYYFLSENNKKWAVSILDILPPTDDKINYFVRFNSLNHLYGFWFYLSSQYIIIVWFVSIPGISFEKYDSMYMSFFKLYRALYLANICPSPFSRSALL